MTKDSLYNFFYTESKPDERFKMFNFLCDETDADTYNGSFSEKFIEWIGRNSVIANKIGGLDNYYELKKNIKKAKTNEDKAILNRNYQSNLKKSIDEIKGD